MELPLKSKNEETKRYTVQEINKYLGKTFPGSDISNLLPPKEDFTFKTYAEIYGLDPTKRKGGHYGDQLCDSTIMLKVGTCYANVAYYEGRQQVWKMEKDTYWAYIAFDNRVFYQSHGVQMSHKVEVVGTNFHSLALDEPFSAFGTYHGNSLSKSASLRFAVLWIFSYCRKLNMFPDNEDEEARPCLKNLYRDLIRRRTLNESRKGSITDS
ncbi:hypothetical protein CC78DRAFT_37986 [Lojkania enalia]|uniref:Uncharacterized protein n=1 Tax=Lojkania enalia TaxID=147567 RepID=A0A9P4K4T3_9PLEO|nr:hypothetical protein CC78DRAFT_37986 [Didymosphaeria enalia]